MPNFLKNIVEIISGFSFRKNASNTAGGDIAIIQARDITGDIYIKSAGLAKVAQNDIQTKAFVKKGDVVIAERGAFRAGLIGDEMEKTIASSSTFILRPTFKELDPEYLVAYFNSKAGNNNILKTAKGSLIKNISKRELEDVEIPIPSLNEQKTIVEIFKNNLRRQELLNRKKELIGQVAESAIKQILKN
jgi:restriction endonuclease S subunit